MEYIKANYFIYVPGEELGDMFFERFKLINNDGKEDKKKQDPISEILVKMFFTIN